MSPESIQEVIHRHTSHFTSLQGKEYHWNHPDLPKITEALMECELDLLEMLHADRIYRGLPDDEYREQLRDIQVALEIRRQELF